MSYTFKSPETAQEWRDYFELRWKILRAPWQQAPGSERDELEDTAYHVMVTDAAHGTVGVGRLHQLSNARAQIRYMAVSPEQQGHGIGSRILRMLETYAKAQNCKEIVLNARTTCLAFYKKHDYQVISDAPLLFASVAHKHMCKQFT